MVELPSQSDAVDTAGPGPLEARGFLERSAAPSLALYGQGAEHALADVIVVHGLCEHAGRHARIHRALLEGGFAVHAFDLRGHGRSAGARAHVRRFADLEQDLFDVRNWVLRSRQRQGLAKRPWFVYGHSLGALITAQSAIGCPGPPDGVSGVVLASAPFEVDPAAPNWALWIGARMQKVFPRAKAPARVGAEGISSDPEEQRAYLEDPWVTRRFSLRMGHEILEAGEQALGEARRLKVPVLALHGREDPIAQWQGSEAFLERTDSPERSLHLYDGLRHELHNERHPFRDRVLAEAVHWLRERASP